MRRRRGSNRRDANDALDTFLDTVCNLFGIIIFLAMMIVVLASTTGEKIIREQEEDNRSRNEEILEVWKTHPGYIEWAAELDDPSDIMKKFKDFAKKKLVEVSEEPPPQKKPRTEAPSRENEEKKCVVCMHREVECAFVPCGHCVACMRCAALIEADGCPICRAQILMPLRIYA